MVWKGVIIEESLEDKGLLDAVNVVQTKEESLGGEEERGTMHLRCFELEDDKKDEFVSKAKEMIKDRWYIHIFRDGTMVVIFKGRSFEFTKDQKERIEEAKRYGVSIGILEEQLEFETLMKYPFGSPKP